MNQIPLSLTWESRHSGVALASLWNEQSISPLGLIYNVLAHDVLGRWCRMRESNPQLTITNGLLYHLTNPASSQRNPSTNRTINRSETITRCLIDHGTLWLFQTNAYNSRTTWSHAQFNHKTLYLFSIIYTYQARLIAQSDNRNFRPAYRLITK